MTTVECPRCGTTYRVPPRHRGRQRPTFECASCHHVFGPEEPVAGDADWDDDEAWVMDDEATESTDRRDDRTDHDDGTDEEEEEEDDEADVAPASLYDDERDGDDEADEPDEAEDDEDDVAARATPTRRRRRRAVAAGERRRARATPARFALRSLLVVTLLYAVLAVYMSTHAAAARAVLARIPVVGSRLAEKRVGHRQIQLRNVRGTFARPRDDADGQPVFVVSAIAVNRASVPLSTIELRATLLGRSPMSRIFRCTGAPVDVARFSRGELKLVSEFPGDRPKPVAPDETIRCQTVFLSPPRESGELVVEVVRASGS
jgi:hypothetical protein